MGGSSREFDAHFAAARPQALAALTRYFRDLDTAEEAFQEACLRALRTWPAAGVPRDPAAWMILVGRNFGLDESRRRKRLDDLVREDPSSEPEDVEAEIVAQLEAREYRDDVLRLFFICCHPDLPGPQQIALALKIVAGLSVAEIARAFLVAPRAMEQRITRAKRCVARADVPFCSPSPEERAERLRTVATTIYLLFNEGYSASGGDAQVRVPLCEEAIRLARLLLRLFPREGEIMGLLALFLLQHSRSRARLDPAGALVLLEDQDRGLWDRAAIAEGRVLVEKALRRGRPGPFQVQAAIAAVHGQARRARDTDWAEIDRLYAVLERLEPSPVVTLNRAVAVSKARGAREALALLTPLAEALDRYFHYHGVRGGLLAQLDRLDEARRAYERALALARTPAEREHLGWQLERLGDVAVEP